MSVSHSQQTVLIADDEESVRDFVSTVLGSAGFNVLTAKDGDEALHMIWDVLPDLVILDVIMPCREGLEVYAELRADSRTAHLPVIMLTSVNEYRLGEPITGDSISAKHGCPPEAFLEKPVSSSELLQTVKKVLGITG